MRAAIIENGVVTNIIMVDSLDVFPNLIEVTDAVHIGSLFDGSTFTKPVPAPKPVEVVKEEVTAEISKRLDEFAKTRNYDSILSACTYATSSVEQFAKEGQYCVNMRDATWGKLYQIMQEVEAGTRPMPDSYDDIESELPVLEWPA